MSKEDKSLAKTNDHALSTNTVDAQKYELIKRMYAKGATDDEFEVFMAISKKYKLDPLLKQIWCIKRNDKDPALVMTSRDGYLDIAHRSGQFNGMESGTDDDEKGAPVKAWCTVYRKDMDHPFKSEVKFSEYVQNSYVWQKYPSAMLIKVAEVFALKRAFSINGLVTQEEMGDGYEIGNASRNIAAEKAAKEQELLDRALQEMQAAKTEKELLEIWNDQEYFKAGFKTNEKFMEAMKQRTDEIRTNGVDPTATAESGVIEAEIVDAPSEPQLTDELYDKFQNLLDLIDQLLPESPKKEWDEVRDAVMEINQNKEIPANYRSEITTAYQTKKKEKEAAKK